MSEKKVMSFRHRLFRGETLLGGWLQIPSAASAELIGDAGFDWAAVDCEHGLIDIHTASLMLQALEARDVAGLIRLPGCDGIWIRRALDAGAAGLIVPMVNSAAIAEEAVRWVKYPPVGERGFGFSRANGYGDRFDSYSASANDDIALVVQIEHIAAVRDIEKILDVPGIDAVFIGPYDLAGSMGRVGLTGHPEVLEACQKVKDAADARKLPAGIHVVSSDARKTKPYIKAGFRLLALGIDTLFIRNTSRKMAEETRSLASEFR